MCTALSVLVSDSGVQLNVDRFASIQLVHYICVTGNRMMLPFDDSFLPRKGDTGEDTLHMKQYTSVERIIKSLQIKQKRDPSYLLYGTSNTILNLPFCMNFEVHTSQCGNLYFCFLMKGEKQEAVSV